MSILAVVLAAGLTVAPGSSDAWQVDLAHPVAAGDMSTVGSASTHLVDYPTHTLNHLANTFDSSAPVDIRGQRPDGSWTEWAETPTVLPDLTREAQVRVVYTDAAPTSVTVYPSVSGGPAPARADELTTQVFATREGLVGGRTASGHVIVARDHFVALPSRRGLSTKDSGDYTAKVCAPNGRCEWAPVWDVGPWNTKDDYWNPGPIRQMWTDLPRGRPQAQAAKQDGYNGGKDQFGRVVRNPAGIDLADGMFWDGLGLTTNAWVTVTFQWTGTGPTATAPTLVNIRNAPAPTAPIVGLAAPHAHIHIDCQTGDWLRVAPTMWLPITDVTGITNPPAC